MPGFDEAAVLDADDRDSGGGEIFAGGFVATFDGPAERDEVAVTERDARRHAGVHETGLQRVEKGFKFTRTADSHIAVVKHAVRREEFGDDFAAALIPDFFEPAMDEMFVLFGGGERYGRG